MIIAILIGLLILAMSNFVRHIVKRGNVAMHPLMRFYLFIFLLLLSSGIFTFFLCAIDSLTYFPIIVNLPPTFKILLGTEQVWMMLELALRIRQCNLIDLDEG